MSTQTESVSSVFELAFENLRKTAESSIEMQQELFRQWGAQWPGLPQPQTAWVERAQKFQKEWSKTVKELLSKHREVVDEQFEAAIESLEEAFRVAQSSDPQEYAKRCEALCKKSLVVLRETGEQQVKETQEALNKWIGLAVKTAS
jgi:broad specificity phosphatase PhoE